MSRFLDPRLAQLTPYVPGEQSAGDGVVKLNTNESPYPPSPAVLRAVEEQASLLHLYPSPTGGGLAPALARRFGVGPANVLVGNGSDELLAFVFQALCPASAAFADLTYGFYPVFCGLYGVRPHILPLREDFTLAPEDYFGLHKTIFIANPNAPTGLALSHQDIEAVLRHNPDSLVVVDEAYIHFGAESCAPLLAAHENLLLVGTFSKSYSLAGGRLGYALGAAEVIADLNRVRCSFNPYNVNRVTLAAGAAALADQAYYSDCWRRVVATRARATQALVQMGFACTDSAANFIFAAHPAAPAQALYQQLKQRGVLVRWFDLPRIRNYLRITVGSDAQMDTLLGEIRAMLPGA